MPPRISPETAYVLQLPWLWTADEIIKRAKRDGFIVDELAVRSARTRAKNDPSHYDRCGLPRPSFDAWMPQREQSPLARYVLYQDPKLGAAEIFANAKRLKIPGIESIIQVTQLRFQHKTKKYGVYGGAPVLAPDVKPDELAEDDQPMSARSLHEMRAKFRDGDEVLVERRGENGRPPTIHRGQILQTHQTMAAVRFGVGSGARTEMVHYKYLRGVPDEPAAPAPLAPKLDTLRAVPDAFKTVPAVVQATQPQPVVARKTWDDEEDDGDFAPAGPAHSGTYQRRDYDAAVEHVKTTGFDTATLQKVQSGPRVSVLTARPEPPPAPEPDDDFESLTVQRETVTLTRRSEPAPAKRRSGLQTWLELAPTDELAAEEQALRQRAEDLAQERIAVLEQADALADEIRDLQRIKALASARVVQR